jgi:hypothetical protein
VSGIGSLTCGNTGAPLRNRTVDLLLTMENQQCLVQVFRDQIGFTSWDNVVRYSYIGLDVAGSWPPSLAPILVIMRL